MCVKGLRTYTQGPVYQCRFAQSPRLHLYESNCWHIHTPTSVGERFRVLLPLLPEGFASALPMVCQHVFHEAYARGTPLSLADVATIVWYPESL